MKHTDEMVRCVWKKYPELHDAIHAAGGWRALVFNGCHEWHSSTVAEKARILGELCRIGYGPQVVVDLILRGPQCWPYITFGLADVLSHALKDKDAGLAR